MKLPKNTLETIALNFSGIVMFDGDGGYIVADALDPENGDSKDTLDMVRVLGRFHDDDLYFRGRDNDNKDTINLNSYAYVQERRDAEEREEQRQLEEKIRASVEAEQLMARLSPGEIKHLKNLL